MRAAEFPKQIDKHLNLVDASDIGIRLQGPTASERLYHRLRAVVNC
jgi:hypothetical protein